MPFALNKDWNLIAKVIVPLVSQPALVDGGEPVFGVSDILATFFISPSKPGLIWGVGPAISLPSTSVPSLGTEKWSAGPSIVVLKQTGKMMYGMLWNQICSFRQCGPRGRQPDVPATILLYQAKRTLTVTLQSETSANWEVDDDRRTVPINVLFSRCLLLRVSGELQFGFGGYVAHPYIGPSWQIRSAIVILMPRRR